MSNMTEMRSHEPRYLQTSYERLHSVRWWWSPKVQYPGPPRAGGPGSPADDGWSPDVLSYRV